MNNLLAQTHYCRVAQSDIGLLRSTVCVEAWPSIEDVTTVGSTVYSTNDVDLKARSHCGDINEASCHFSVLLQFNSVAAV